MSLYESIFVARQDLSSAQVETLRTEVSKIITEQGGEVVNSEYCGLRNLAYPIKKNRKGHYVLMHLDTPSAAIDEMERKLRLNEDVIRHLTVVTDEHPTGPSILLQQSRSPETHREDYGSREGQGRSSHREGQDRSSPREGQDRSSPVKATKDDEASDEN